MELLTGLGVLGWCFLAGAGTWVDHFSQTVLGSDWQGDRDFFSIIDGTLKGASVSPLAPAPFHRVEVGDDWDDYTVQCRVNAVEPNLLVCTKCALVLRDNGKDGYVFALHVATQSIEVYRLSDQEMLLFKEAPLELKTWYLLTAQLHGPTMDFYIDGQLVGSVTDTRSLSGRVGVAVQDAMDARFDDFTITGPSIPSNGLETSVSHNQLTITWPSALSNYVLKSASNLSPTAPWETVTNTPSTNGNQVSVTLEPSQGSCFYMLIPRSP